MSDLPKPDTLCRRCSLLSFDDAAIGGQEVVDEDGTARLSFPESRIELRPLDWQSMQDLIPDVPDYRLVRLDWKLDETLPNMPHLSRSSRLGCAFCKALRRSLEDTFARERISITAGTMSLVAYLSLVDDGVEGLVVEATYQTSLCKNNAAIRTIFPIEAASSCRNWLGAHRARDSSYLNSVTIRKIRQVLDYCTSECHPESPSSFLPTRLIDIGMKATTVPRLVLSSNIRKTKRTKYAALSYCWGNARDAEAQVKTEIASFEDRCAALPSEHMTPTITDAIALARAIGLRYLWIDALCIIQDDKGDWSHESSQMHLVYRHAFVTFCSLNSDSCHESFLNRAPAIHIPFHSTICKVIKGYYLIRLHSLTVYGVDRTKYLWDLKLSKWNKRCWTYQEQEMSTRLLLFGGLRMHFLCAQFQWSEGDRAPTDRPSSSLGIFDQITMSENDQVPSRELYERWSLLIHDYGPRLVTFDKDRLLAIAGLARMMGKALQDRYLAGLWKDDLQRGLTWMSIHDQETLSHGLKAHIRNIRERDYVAPSWSWAASPRVTKYSYSGTSVVNESTILDATTDADPDDPYGQISGGFLRIRGKVAGMPEWLPMGSETQGNNRWIHRGPNSSFIHVFIDWLYKDKEAGLEVLVVMLLHRIETTHDTRGPELAALLLHPTGELNQYYRVGMISSEGHEACIKTRRWFEDCHEETICII